MRRARLLGAAAGLALLTAACMGGGGEKRPSSGKPSATAPAASPERRFEHFRIVYDTGLDYLDPGLSYTIQGWQAMWNVYLGLLSYKHVSGPGGATLVPALAEALPEVSGEGETYTFRLREGLRYSNGKPVRASDFEYAIKRLYLLDSPGAALFADVEGAEAFGKTEKGDIAGIVPDDEERTIEFRLESPRPDFQNILATLFAAPVPPGTPAKARGAQRPIPATGPYRIARYRPNESFTLVRNPYFRPTASVPPANPDEVTVRIVADATTALRLVLAGKADYDFHQIPPGRLAAVRRKYASRLRIYTPANTYYFFMNTRVAPFDRLEVRQAVNYAIDRRALARIHAGLARPTQNVLPPTYPSYRKLSLYPHDPGRARRLIARAGAAGERVTVWGESRRTSRQAVEYLARVLNEIGLRATVKIVPPALYYTTIGNPRTRAQIGAATWFHDYPHPLGWFDVLLSGKRLAEPLNQNYARANVPELNEGIEELEREPTLSAEVNARWAELDRLVMERALWAPYVNRRFTAFFGPEVDMGCYVNHVLYELDFSRICKQ